MREEEGEAMNWDIFFLFSSCGRGWGPLEERGVTAKGIGDDIGFYFIGDGGGKRRTRRKQEWRVRSHMVLYA